MTRPGAAGGGGRTMATVGAETMAETAAATTIVPALDDETARLVAVAAVIASADESGMRAGLRSAVGFVRPAWVEEVILQSYLFAGFPRALNAMRLWRAASGLPAPETDGDTDGAAADEGGWFARGEATCATVYGPFYDRLRPNIAALHPALDAWMVSDGYGKVLGRPELDLARRELCVVAACVAAQQERQLHSHLYGALHAGASHDAIAAALEVAFVAAAPALTADAPRRYRQLWAKVAGRATVTEE